MEDLIKQITDKFGIDAAKAGDIVKHVLDFVKGHLPENLSGMLSGLTGGGEGGDAGSVLDKAKDMLGGFLK